MQNAGLIFAVPASKLILHDRKAYFSFWPLLAIASIVVSVLVSVLPTILAGQGNADFDGGTSGAWSAVYLAGLGAGAAYNVLQQRCVCVCRLARIRALAAGGESVSLLAPPRSYLIREGMLRPDASLRQFAVASLRMLVHGSLWMLATLAICCWFDVLPWFGTSTTWTQVRLRQHRAAASVSRCRIIAFTLSHAAVSPDHAVLIGVLLRRPVCRGEHRGSLPSA